MTKVKLPVQPQDLLNPGNGCGGGGFVCGWCK